MDKLKQKVLNSLKWRQSVSISAARLNISEIKYTQMKDEILKEKKQIIKKNRFFDKASNNAEFVESYDLEKGEGKLSATFSYEPKSAEEIIQLLKIDVNKWKLSQYWNKQMGDH